ncbi:hypothetical protein BDP27DRAFT_1392094 [Rhodocollybia butyracea]|uniref:Uncharacterized protein n=1 Tax=Rhodocollybia butyracea TaxID=206335 RepID=A0A9P5U7N9_9AGAR|nr:hypothetical protein BDP27DRAFT_1392094 [Rhodocollybia butyracea]
MFDDDLSSVSSGSSSNSPTKKRPRPPSLTCRDAIGIDPEQLIGRKIIRISLSTVHPTLTLDFHDNTSAQILVDGYSPRWKGVPKQLEMDEAFRTLATSGTVGMETLEIVDCAIIKLCDKAFQRKQKHDHEPVRWDQEHAGVAFKFSDQQNPRWHCIWATLVEYDESECIFRSYSDCYLDFTQRSPRKKTWRKSFPAD